MSHKGVSMLDILHIVGKHRYQSRGAILDHLGMFVIDIERSYASFQELYGFLSV